MKCLCPECENNSKCWEKSKLYVDKLIKPEREEGMIAEEIYLQSSTLKVANKLMDMLADEKLKPKSEWCEGDRVIGESVNCSCGGKGTIKRVIDEKRVMVQFDCSLFNSETCVSVEGLKKIEDAKPKKIEKIPPRRVYILNDIVQGINELIDHLNKEEK